MSIRVPRVAGRIYRDVQDHNNPRWFVIVAWVAGIAVAGYVLVQLFLPDDSAKQQQLAEQWNKANAAPAAPRDVTDPSDAGSAGPQAGADTSVPRSDGSGQAQIPLAAVDMARNAVTAVYTGDFSTVMFADGVAQPARLPQKFPHPQVAAPTLDSDDAGQLTFRFVVDPDGPDGAEGPRALKATVLNTSGLWEYKG